MHDEKKLYIILLNYNGWQDTIECLESILKSNYKDYKIIIVDNNSTDNSVEHIISWARGDQEVIYKKNTQLKELSYPPVKKPLNYIVYQYEEALSCDASKEKKNKNALIIIKSGVNGGFAFGNNVGIRYAMTKNDCDSILLLNNDTVINYNTLQNIVDAKTQYGDNALYGGRILYYDKPDTIWYDGGHFNEWLGKSYHIGENRKNDFSSEVRRVNFITFCYILIPKNVLHKIGLIDERYFMYVEDLDYCYKAWKAGVTLYHVCNSLVWHKVGASSGSKTNPFSSYYNYRNSLLFRFKIIDKVKRYTAVCYNLLRMPFLVIKWLMLKPGIAAALLKATRDAIKMYMNEKSVQSKN